MDKKELAEKLKAGVKAHKEKILKTSDTPKEMTPLERAKALRRKEADKYDNYIAGKLLPGLDK